MPKPKKIVLPWLFLAIIVVICLTLYGCRNESSTTLNNVEIENPTETPDIILSDFTFGKVRLGGETNDPDFVWFGFYPCTECTIGDTIMLMCGVENGNWNTEDLSGIPIIAKVTTSHNDTENFLLTRNEDVGYLLPVPHPPRVYTVFIPYIKSTPDGLTNSIIKISPEGDILTAEIKYLNQKLITTLRIKGK